MKKEDSFKKTSADNIHPGTLLVIKPGAIGDVLQMTPVVRSIKRHFQRSRIIFLVGNQAAFDLLENNPNVDEIVLFPKGTGLREWGRVLGLADFLKKKEMELILNYQPSNWRWRILTLLLKPRWVL